MPFPKSKNFFAALDDDDDDDVKPVVKQAPPKVQSVTKPVAPEPAKEHRYGSYVPLEIALLTCVLSTTGHDIWTILINEMHTQHVHCFIVQLFGFVCLLTPRNHPTLQKIGALTTTTATRSMVVENERQPKVESVHMTADRELDVVLKRRRKGLEQETGGPTRMKLERQRARSMRTM